MTTTTDGADRTRELVPVSRTATRATLFTYCAVTWNPHRIHYDRDYAVSLGHSDVILPGALQADWMLEFVSRSVRAGLRVWSFSYTAVSPAIVDTELTMGGTLTEYEGEHEHDGAEGAPISVDTWIRSDSGEVTMRGRVELVPSRRE